MNKKVTHYFSLIIFICLTSICFATEISFNNPLVDAVEAGNETEVISLIKSCSNVDSRGSFGVTPLMRAVYQGNIRIIRILLGANADVDAVDIGGASAMHIAARRGDVSVLKLLVEEGATIDHRDNDNWTPLMRATSSKQKDAVAYLLKKGADPFLTNRWHQNSLIIAALSGDNRIFDLFVASKALDKASALDKQKILKIASSKKNSNLKSSVEESLSDQDLAKTEEANVPTAKAPVKTPEPTANVNTEADGLLEDEKVAEPSASTVETKIAESKEVKAAKQEKPKQAPKMSDNKPEIISITKVGGAILSPINKLFAANPFAKKENLTKEDVIEIKSDNIIVEPKDIKPVVEERIVEKTVPTAQVISAKKPEVIKAEPVKVLSKEPNLGAVNNLLESMNEKDTHTKQAEAPQDNVNYNGEIQALPWIVEGNHAITQEELNEELQLITKQNKAEKQKQLASTEKSKPKIVVSEQKTSKKEEKKLIAHEAIRVPSNNKPNDLIEVQIADVEKFTPNRSLPYAPVDEEFLWVESPTLADEESVNELFEVIKDIPELEGKRFKIAYGQDDTPISVHLRVGPAHTPEEANLICEIISNSTNCRIVSDDEYLTPNIRSNSKYHSLAPKNINKYGGKNLYYIQLGSFKNEREAEKYADKMQKKYTNLLAKLKRHIDPPKYYSMKDGFYKLRYGPFISYKIAEAKTNMFIAEAVNCVVVKE